MSGPEHRHDDDRTGNGIVNDGPDNTPHTDPEQDGEREQGEDAIDGGAEEAPASRSAAATGTSVSGASATGDAVTGNSVTGISDSVTTVSVTTVSGPRKAGSREAGSRGGVEHEAGASGGGTLTELFGAGGAPGGVDMDEVALRRMLHGAVRDLEPSDGILDHLHRAVPARRARRRQAVVGAAAAALLIGTAVPAFVHVTNSEGSATASPAIAGHGEQAQGGNGQDAGDEAGSKQSAGPAAEQNEGVNGEADSSTAPSAGPGAEDDDGGTAGLEDSPGAEAAGMPVCGPDQLGVASAQAGSPGADGTVYGSFRIANVSDRGCSVTSNGTVGFQAGGAADPLKITVVQHTAGDPAAGLPDPSLEPGKVVLKPAMAYEVRFAWVPTDTCPTGGGSPSPTPTDGDGGGGIGGASGSDTGSTDTAPQFGSADGGPADGTVAVTHTPESGAPTAQTTISRACAGTIYRTGVLDAS
ncbi:hypothetical protein EES45_18840 [Streptomyces sp. ADI97-07]|uniref:hypothetical protein n=1 Tax=Streptomyces sp. ADI97-07 TaxID=1522762 RepID=UPI000F54C7D0|nr:hypothetical protein [Streptomyces sp. ADI97-07]RPK78063.1 hypothetical protein EES45_18840 [Streptomyces sp. ADI97-07]